jgi:drug/metabolite transporter (DMT)-like permease
MASPLRETIVFFDQIGLYDVVLPFILIFTVVFAIFEKTKVLGMEEVDGKKYTKKNLNAITAFVVAFLVIAAKELVEIINQTVAQAVIVLFFSILFLMLVGAFHKEGDPIYLKGGWHIAFMGIVFISIVGIFLNAIKDENGVTWLERITSFSSGGSGDSIVGAVILLVIVVVFIAYAVKEPEKHEKH